MIWAVVRYNPNDPGIGAYPCFIDGWYQRKEDAEEILHAFREWHPDQLSVLVQSEPPRTSLGSAPAEHPFVPASES